LKDFCKDLKNKQVDEVLKEFSQRKFYYTYIYIYIYIYIHIYIYIYIHIYIYLCVCACMYGCARACMYVSMCVFSFLFGEVSKKK